MKCLYFSVPFILISSFGFAASKVDLNRAFQFALEKTETPLIDRENVNAADAKVKQQRGNFLPQLSAGADYSPESSYTNEKNSVKLTLTQSLFRGGQYKSAYASAQSGKVVSQRLAEDSKNKIYVSVAESFFAVRAAEEELKNLNSTIEAAQTRLGDLQKRLKIGRSRAGEVLTAQSQLADLQSQREAAEGQLLMARDQFAFVTGLENDTELETQNSSIKPKILQDYLVLIPKRPDILALDAKYKAANEDVRGAWGKHLPTVDAVGNYYLNSKGTASRDKNDWDAMVQLTLPLFEGGTTHYTVKETQSKAALADLALRQKIRDADREVRSNYHNVVSLAEQIEALEKAAIAAEKNYREQSRDFRNSLVTNLDVIQSLDAFHKAKRSLDKTRFDAQIAWAKLKASVAQVP